MELITKQKVLEILNRVSSETGFVSKDAVRDAILKAPPRTASWEPVERIESERVDACTNCGYIVSTFYTTAFCPGCGCKMLNAKTIRSDPRHKPY